MLAGGYPVAPFVAAAEDDPTQTFPPGAGLLAMPPPAELHRQSDGDAGLARADAVSQATASSTPRTGWA